MMRSTYALKVPVKRRPECIRKHHASIFLSLPTPDRDFGSLEIQILDAEFETFLQSETSPVEQHRYEMGHARERVENLSDFSRVKTTGTFDGVRARGTMSIAPIS